MRIAIAVAALLCAQGAIADDSGVLPDVRSRTGHSKVERSPGVPSDADLVAANARIGSVHILNRNIFDTSRRDEDTALFRLANRLHFETRESAIAEQLLFHEGERYDARLLAESERILRTTRYLQDASIRPTAWHDGVVDIEVDTRDVWTLSPDISFGRKGGKNSVGFGIEELNFMGLGSQISLGHTSDVDRSATTLRFSDSQVFGSWWTVTAGYSNNSDGQTKELDLERPFYALDSRWAAGVAARSDDRIDSRYDLGEISDQFGVQDRKLTIYGGRSQGLQHGWTSRLTFGLTWDEKRFENIVGETGPTALLPEERKLVYPWVGYEWIQDEYEKTRNRDQIERTEDFLLGFHAQARLGRASASLGSDRDAWIFDGLVSRGLAISDRQRLLLSSSMAGRYENSGFADLRTGVSARYYFRQSPRRLLYLGAVADAGSNLDLDDQILLGGDNGLRGYPLRYQAGEGRWLVTAEQRVFTNWYPFRLFNVGGAVFADVGRTWGANPGGTPSQGVLKDVGFGLRLGNSRSALGNVLHFDIAAPLDGDSSIEKIQFLISTQQRF